MQSAVRTTWTGFVVSFRQQLHTCAKTPTASLPSLKPRHLQHNMDSARPLKRQRMNNITILAQTDSPVSLSTELAEQAVPSQQNISQVGSPMSQPQARTAKVLPTPQLISPGPADKCWPHRPDRWDCAALLVDKPQTWTSFDVCGKLKGVLKVKKIGHAGTLDPMATGLLIICTGKATKSIDSFQAMHKEYSGTMKLGEATASYDADGEITETLPWEHLTLDQLKEEAQTNFVGDLQQIPPMYSALRVKGKRLYESAREGKVVERAARNVHVSQFDLVQDLKDPQKIHFYIACSKGTYIRSLAHDLAQAVGTAAHLVALRREAIGVYNVKDAWTVEQLHNAFGAPKQKQSTQQNKGTVPSETLEDVVESKAGTQQRLDGVQENVLKSSAAAQ